MDLKLLADALVITLAPVLPHLITGGTEAVKAVGKKVGDEAFELGQKLWGRLRKPVEERPRALGAVEEVAEAPEDDEARAGLRRQLVRILEADPDLASELAKLLDAAGRGTSYQAYLRGSGVIAQGPGAVAAGEGGIAVGGSVTGNVSAERIERGILADDRPRGVSESRGKNLSFSPPHRPGMDRDLGESESKPAGRITRSRRAPQQPPSKERQVQSGLALVSTPGGHVDLKEPLSAGTHYFYWLQVGRAAAGAAETQHVDLPEEVPLGATIEVALFGFPGEIEIEPGADVGVLRLREDGIVEVEHQPGKGEASRRFRKRLLFPVKMPKRAGVARLRCNLYYRKVLILSLLLEAVVAAKSRATPPALDLQGRRLRSTPDYVLSRNLSPAHLSNLGEHRFSLMINGDEATHDFRFFGSDGAEWVKNDVRVQAVTLQHEIRLAREALRLAAWGEAEEWNPKWDPETKYRYNRARDRRELAADLARLAYAGYRLYLQLSRRLAQGDREAFERVTLASGLAQVALKESASLVWPAAILYDIPVDSNAFPIVTTEHRLCETFEAALAGIAPLEECACFHGDCAQRRRVAEILADPPRLVMEAGPVICPSGFWGFRHALGLPVSVADAPEVPGHIPFQGAPRIAIGVSTDPKLRLREKHEATLQKLHAGLGWERGATREEVLRMLKTTKAQIVYFYCHGGVTPSQVPYFEVGYNESGITPDNLPGNGIVWKEPRPLVFINGCHTTALTPEVALNLVSAFVEESAAAGVIGTEITIFERLACDFAEACLQRFLNGAKLGQAVRGARLALLRQGNPLGLAYIPFALASLDLVEQPRIRLTNSAPFVSSSLGGSC